MHPQKTLTPLTPSQRHTTRRRRIGVSWRQPRHSTHYNTQVMVTLQRRTLTTHSARCRRPLLDMQYGISKKCRVARCVLSGYGLATYPYSRVC